MTSRTVTRWLGAGSVLMAVGCGSSEGGPSAAPSQGGSSGSGGSGGNGGNAGALTVEMGGGGSAGTSAGAGSGGGGQAPLEPDPCPVDQVDCNGQCIHEGSTTPGCTVLAAAPAGTLYSQGMKLDQDFIYWFENKDFKFSVARAPKAGGGRALLATTDDDLDDIALNATQVAWLGSDRDGNHVRAVLKAGGVVTDIYAAPPPLQSWSNLALSDTRAYYTHEAGAGAEIASVDMQGKNPLVHGMAELSRPPLALGPEMVHWISFGFGGYKLMQSPLAGGEASLLSTLSGQVGTSLSTFQVLGGFVYVYEHGIDVMGPLMRVPLAGGTPSAVYSTNPGAWIALTETAAYVLDHGTFFEVPFATGKPQKLTQTRSQARSFAADSSGLYAVLEKESTGASFIVKLK